MSWGGSVQAMIASLKNNKSLLRRKRVFTILKEEIESDRLRNPIRGKKIQFQDSKIIPLSNAEKNKIKETIRRRIKKERWISAGIAALFILCTFIVFYGLYSLGELSRGIKADNTYVSPDNTKFEEEKKFQFYINDGFQWLKKGEFHNAIFQFKLAVKSKPDNINAQLGLTQSFLGNCIITREDCNKAEEQFDLFIDKYSENDSVKIKLSNYLLSIGDSSKLDLLH